MTLYDFIFKTANLYSKFMLFSVINISYVSLNMHFELAHTQKIEEFT